MRSAALRFGALFLVLALSTVAAYAQQQPGLSPGSAEETTSADLDGDGLPQEFEFRLARHFFPTIWYDSGEDTSSPGGNHDHREHNQRGRLLFRVRPHPQSSSHIAITYALLYRVDGGERAVVTDVGCHKGDVEPFAITLKFEPACALGWGMDSIKTWAHTGEFGDDDSLRFDSGCNWGFSVRAVSHDHVVLASENKHGNYLSESECDNALVLAENCDLDWTAGDVNAWTGLNVGEPEPVWARLHDDLSPLGFNDRLWSGSFCGGPHSTADQFACFSNDCPASASSKFTTDQFVAPFTPPPPVYVPPGLPPSVGDYVGCFTDDPNRALPQWLGQVGDIDSCIGLASAGGLAYAGLQWYGECWGGNQVRYAQVPDSECNTPCASGQMCGGGWRNSIYTTGRAPSPPPPPPPSGSGMQQDSAIRGCSDWSWWSPVYQPDPGACHAYCSQNGANACEWYGNGDCYVEFGSGCYVQGGFPGWWAAVF